MKELKPKLIFADSNRKRSGFFKYLTFFIIFLIGFCLGYLTSPNNTLYTYKNNSLNNTRIRQFVSDSFKGIRGNINIFRKDKITVTNRNQENKPQLTSHARSNGYDHFTDKTDSRQNNPAGNMSYDNEKFTLQIAAFETDKKTNSVVAELKNKGYDAYSTIVVNSKGSKWHLVRIGIFNSYEDAYEYAKSIYKTDGVVSQIEILEPTAVTKLSNFEIE